jgi:hypothetical protein
MKRPINHDEEPQPRNIQRADVAPSTGYALVVDGCIKTQFADEGAAKKAAEDLKRRFPKLQVQIYDAATKTRATLTSVDGT